MTDRFDIRAEVPVLFIISAPDEASALIPFFYSHGGIPFLSFAIVILLLQINAYRRTLVLLNNINNKPWP